MAKYLFISPMGEGHINPTIGLVRELVSRGEQVVYYSKNEYRDKLEKAGATFRPISQKAQTLMNEYLTKNMVRRLTNPNIQNIAERIPKMMSMMEWITDDILQEIKGESYDYIIHDAQAAPGEWIANKLQLPTIATWTVFAFKKQSPLFKQLLKQSGPAVLEAMEKMKETFLANKKRLEEKYGVPMKEFPNMACEGDLNIVFTSRYFQPQADFVGENYLFVGPSIADRQDQGDFPLEELKETPVVFMSLGTIINNQPDLYRICIDAFKDFDGKVVISIGNQLAIDELGPIPNHFIVRNYVPQLDVLRHTDAFITHCGMNSTSEALYFHVPLVMLPMMNDQPIVANRVKELGAGVILDHQTLDASQLRNAVFEVLNNPIYKRNAQKIGKSFRDSGGAVKAVDELLKLVHSVKK